MAFSFSSTNLLFSISITLFSQLSKVKSSDSICFSSTNFPQDVSDITFQGDATTDEGTLKLTATDNEGSPLETSGGRALYSSAVQLWERETDRQSSFSTSFSFVIDPPPSGDSTGDGMTFFLAPLDTQIPSTIEGGFLALLDPSTGQDPSKNQLVAVEFDVYKNEWDIDENPHIGIDVNQIRSEATAEWNIAGVPAGSIAFARMNYDAASKELNVSLTYPNVPNSPKTTLSRVVDLKDILPEWVRVGFSGATGSRVEKHKVLSWSFSSNLEITRSVAKN